MVKEINRGFAAFAGISTLFLLAIMPRIRKRHDISIFKGWNFAHRGLHENGTDAPENSLPAFKKAVDEGFAIELDVQLTSDKVPVVFHDFNLKRACGTDLKVRDLTLDELRSRMRLFGTNERIPTLTEVLELVDGRVPLLVEIKSEDFDMTVCRRACELLDKYKGEYCVESFNPLVLLWFRMKRPNVIRGQLSDNFIKDGVKGNKWMLTLHSNLVTNFATKPDFISFNHKYANTLGFKLNRRLFKVPAFAWTIKNEKELNKAKKYFDTAIFDSFVPVHRRNE